MVMTLGLAHLLLCQWVSSIVLPRKAAEPALSNAVAGGVQGQLSHLKKILTLSKARFPWFQLSGATYILETTRFKPEKHS